MTRPCDPPSCLDRCDQPEDYPLIHTRCKSCPSAIPCDDWRSIAACIPAGVPGLYRAWKHSTMNPWWKWGGSNALVNACKARPAPCLSPPLRDRAGCADNTMHTSPPTGADTDQPGISVFKRCSCHVTCLYERLHAGEVGVEPTFSLGWSQDPEPLGLPRAHL